MRRHFWGFSHTVMSWFGSGKRITFFCFAFFLSCCCSQKILCRCVIKRNLVLLLYSNDIKYILNQIQIGFPLMCSCRMEDLTKVDEGYMWIKGIVVVMMVKSKHAEEQSMLFSFTNGKSTFLHTQLLLLLLSHQYHSSTMTHLPPRSRIILKSRPTKNSNWLK